ncbi:hypothetical protein TNIN_21411 [Trichonephila inaurata madagascariensis]|uniref:Uncharacterized protein n=1 Tax=Trichonephila inaurata madagascariensis TaxID=2747483 RepID=A0A8X7CJ65_9ARAC|nr:hypothetical protein TNIN_21411 [Trichonephila inaurata madagascariensis]
MSENASEMDENIRNLPSDSRINLVVDLGDYDEEDFWPDDYFEVNGSELNEIISKAYSELKLKNVAISVEMEVLVRYLLIEQSKSRRGLRKRVLQGRRDFHTPDEIPCQEHPRSETTREVNLQQTTLGGNRVLFGSLHQLQRFIARKKFVLCFHPHEKENFVPSGKLRPLLSVEKPAILKKKEKELGKYPSTIPTRQHNIAIAQVLGSAPCFKELYNDYKQTRDMYSLEIIKCYIDSVLTADVEASEGRLIITRALQVIGEHLKDTLETPKLSDATGELLLYSLPVNTRDVIIDLRNSLSHAESLSKRSDIKQNTSDFFSKIQNDFIKLDTLVVEILRKKKTKILVGLLNQVFDCKRLEDIQEAIGTFDMAEANEALVKGPVTEELEQLEKLISELRNKIGDITLREKEIFEED